MQRPIDKSETHSRTLVLVSIMLILTLLLHLSVGLRKANQTEAAPSTTPKYIFIFMADGVGIPHLEIARQYSLHIEKRNLFISSKIMKEGSLGLITTHPANSLSTDSAAAATAVASGCKANLGMLGICADESMPKTALELAKEKGMRVGLVTNAAVYDATPAAFVSHVSNRRLYSAIIDRYLEFEPEILFGGGRDQFFPQTQPGSARKDDADMIALFKNKGYLYASEKQELSRVNGSKVLGLFNLKDMSFEIDRDKKKEPSVYDMTAAAIRILESGNKRGFVVLIETENTDTAGHLTDVASVIHDFLEFDRAVGLAYDFYRQHSRETLIVVTSDHDTGGLGFTLALKDLTSTRGSNRVAATVEDLKKIESIPISLRKAIQILGPSPTPEAIDELMRNYFREFTLAPDLKNAILNRQPISRSIFVDPIANALGMMIANNTQAYWLTSAHTNHPVFIATLGVGAERFRGYQDNTDFGKKLMAIVQGEHPS